jgi:hypothetical protein
MLDMERELTRGMSVDRKKILWIGNRVKEI